MDFMDKLLALILAWCVWSPMAGAVTRAFVNPEVFDSVNFCDGGQVNLLVTMRHGTGSVLAQVAPELTTTTGTRTTKVYNALREHARTSQHALMDQLVSMSSGVEVDVKITSYWITNQIYIQNVSMNVVRMLANRDDVSRVEKEWTVRLVPDEQSRPSSSSAVGVASNKNNTPTATWNILRIRAPSVWVEGVNGTGVIVGNINAGVRHTHEILRSSYKNDSYSWFDPVTNTSTPFDDYDLGTKNMGVMVGAEGFGVAPGAKWISCKAFDANALGYASHILECAQFMLCPTRPDGSGPDCAQAPHVVHNPWFDDNAFYREDHERIINGWRAAGIIPIFGAARNNTGKGCGSLEFPATLKTVIAVGVTDEEEKLTALSGRGPVHNRDFNGNDPDLQVLYKPDISAPGDNINSSSKNRDDSYGFYAGPSQSSAHVAGVVALLLSANPRLSFDEVKTVLQNTAHRELGFNCSDCDGRSDSMFPNHHFGAGRVDALSAYQCVQHLKICFRHIGESNDIEWDHSGDCRVESDGASLLLILAFAVGGVLIVVISGSIWFVRTWNRGGAVSRPNDDALIRLEAILQKFRAGTWPGYEPVGTTTLAHYAFASSETDSEAGNFLVPVAAPYDVTRYEIDAESLQVDETLLIGSGQYGLVFKGKLISKRIQNQQVVAVKRLKTGVLADDDAVTSFLKELKLMIHVGVHEHVVRLLGACTVDVRSLCLVLEYCEHGSLSTYLAAHRGVFNSPQTSPSYVHVANTFESASGSLQLFSLTRLGVDDLLQWALQIATGMEYLAARKIVHGDLALRNVLLDEERVVKISDFGLGSRLYEYAKYVKTTEQRLLPWRWMAPETLTQNRFSYASDVWAFGVTAWELFSLGQVPYPGSEWAEPFVQQLLAGYRNSRPEHATEEMYSIMMSCWVSEAAERPTMTQLRERLSVILQDIIN